jgi:hypothetical protein
MVTLSHMADDTWKRWTPDAQARALVALREMDQENWAPFYCKRQGCDGDPHDDWTWQHARADQHPPPGEAWRTWLLRGGRGSGKTRTGTEWINRRVEVSPLVALISE